MYNNICVNSMVVISKHAFIWEYLCSFYRHTVNYYIAVMLDRSLITLHYYN